MGVTLKVGLLSWACVFSSRGFFPFPPPLSPTSLSARSTPKTPIFSYSPPSCSMESQNKGRPRFLDLPYTSPPHRNLIVDLVSTLETRLLSHLLPCTLPPDVQYYSNPSGTAQGTLDIRSGLQSSPIDLILGSWLHTELPSGGALNITTLSGYLRPSTDAPHFLIELIQSSPTSLVLILDLLPRKDLVLYPDYLLTFYEGTQLDKHRQSLMSVPEVQPYFSPSLYVRSAFSPTVIFVRVDTEASGSGRMEEILQDKVTPIAMEVLKVWLDQCVHAEREVGEMERAYLKKRDRIFKNQAIEIDLGSNLPRLFGAETGDRVLTAIREVYNA